MLLIGQNEQMQESLGGSVSKASDFGSAHDLAVHEFKSRIRLSAVRTEPASAHDLAVHEFKSRIRLSAVSIEPASDPLSPSLSASPLLVLSQK